MPTTVYVGESKARGFRFACAVVADSDAQRCRAAMLLLRQGPTRRLHFVKETNASRKEALAVISGLPVAHVVFDVSPRPEGPPPRARGLLALAEWASMTGASAIVLERDSTEVERDRRILYSALLRTSSRRTFDYRHADAEFEPLLWIPDAIAWSWTRGGEWRRIVRALGVTVVRV